MDMKVLHKFEANVCRPLVDTAPVRAVALGRQRLDDHAFGRMLCGYIMSADVFVVDYYGYLRRSHGFNRMAFDIRRDASRLCGQVRSLECPVIHFASITMEKVIEFAPRMLSDFSTLKEQLLKLRGFK